MAAERRRSPTSDPVAAVAPWWSPLALAVGFLTVLPVPTGSERPEAMGRAVGWFPAVGAALGLLLGAAGLLLDRVLPPGPVAIVVVAVGAALTGALHLDGLIDTADGVFGGRDRERRLAIMRDSRAGAFGVVAGGLALLAAYACLAELHGVRRLVALVLAGGLSRWVLALALVVFPSARADGLGASVRRSAPGSSLFAASLLAVVVAVPFGPLGVAALAVAAAVVVLGGRFLVGRLGGLTGDCCGALAVVAEVAILGLAVAAQTLGQPAVRS